MTPKAKPMQLLARETHSNSLCFEGLGPLFGGQTACQSCADFRTEKAAAGTYYGGRLRKIFRAKVCATFKGCANARTGKDAQNYLVPWRFVGVWGVQVRIPEETLKECARKIS